MMIVVTRVSALYYENKLFHLHPLDHDRVYKHYKVLNTCGSIMEQRTASKQVGNVLTALISCQIFITCEADFLPTLILITGICYLLLYWEIFALFIAFWPL